MLEKKLFKKLKAEHDIYAHERGIVIQSSREILKSAKRAIFALHRGDEKAADVFLHHVEKDITALQKHLARDERLQFEGSYQAALEEYVEARTFRDYLATGSIKGITIVPIAFESYIAGLADVTGELVRQAVLLATKSEPQKIEAFHQTISDIVEQFLDVDLTSKLRQKFDEAKRNLKSMEQILYDLSVKR